MKNQDLVIHKIIVSLLLFSVIATTKAQEAKPLSHIDTDCLFTYHFSYVNQKPREYKITYCFDSRTVNDKEYCALIECDENGHYNKETADNIQAYLREEDNKVYMLLGNIESTGWLGCEYGMRHEETMIYDYNLGVGDSYRIGELDRYVIRQGDVIGIHDWIEANYQYNCITDYGTPYHYLCLWDYGMLTLRDTHYDETLGRMVWTYAQKYFDPEQKTFKYRKSDVTWDADGWRTFDVIDGFGCMQSLVAFPGLFPPCPDLTIGYVTGHNPILCKVQKIDTKEVLFERTDLPHPPLVEELDADGNAVPEYYNIQGMRVANPTEGEIYIVKRGARASKEVYRR